MQHLNVADFTVVGAFAVAFFGLLAWVILYATWTRGDWRLTREGRHLMAFRGSLLLLMAMTIINNAWSSYPGRDEGRIVVVTMFACSVLDGLRVLRLAQRDRRQRASHRLMGGYPASEEDRAGQHQPQPDILGP